MIVVTGADGQLGTAFRNVLPEGSIFLNRSDLDLEDLDSVAPLIRGLKPSAVINCAAYTAVDLAEGAHEIADLVNGYAVGEMAGVCGDLGVSFVTFSTDYVFDGSKDGAYVESDVPCPINAYGESKALGERLALDANPDSLILRTSWLFSGTHRNFVTTILDLLAAGDVSVVSDQTGSPTGVNDLAIATLGAMEVGATGILHLVNRGTTTWHGLASEIADIADIDQDRVIPCTTSERPSAALRPARSVLRSERLVELGLRPMSDYQGSLRRAVDEWSQRS